MFLIFRETAEGIQTIYSILDIDGSQTTGLVRKRGVWEESLIWEDSSKFRGPVLGIAHMLWDMQRAIKLLQLYPETHLMDIPCDSFPEGQWNIF